MKLLRKKEEALCSRFSCLRLMTTVALVLTLIGGPIASSAQSSVDFEPAIILPMQERGFGIAVGDFNNDGILDVAARTTVGSYPYTPTRVYVFLGRGDGTFNLFNTFDLLQPYGTELETADFNNDGNLDLITPHGGSNGYGFGNRMIVHLGDGTGRFTSLPCFTTGGSITIVAIGDFNEDGKLDLAYVSFDSQAIYISNSEKETEHSLLDPFFMATLLHLA